MYGVRMNQIAFCNVRVISVCKMNIERFIQKLKMIITTERTCLGEFVNENRILYIQLIYCSSEKAISFWRERRGWWITPAVCPTNLLFEEFYAKMFQAFYRFYRFHFEYLRTTVKPCISHLQGRQQRIHFCTSYGSHFLSDG